MPVQFGGLVSGMDTNSMISQLVQLERIPINNLNTKKAGYQSDIRNITNMSTRFKSLETALEKLATPEDFVAHKATSTNEDAVKVTTSPGASDSNYEIEVENLAKPPKMRSGPFADSSAVMAAGTLNIGVFGEDNVEITIPEGATLAQVRDLIRDSGAKVDTSIIDSGNGVYLNVTGQKSGHEIGGNPADALVFDFTATGAGEALAMTTTQQAENSRFSVDGLTIERSTNVIDDAVSGLSFELGKETTEPVDVQISVDNSAIIEKVKVFVDAYNSAVDAIKKQNDEGSKRRARDDFYQAVSRTELSGAFPNLAAVGLTMSSTGKLEIDEADFTAALNTNADAVAEIFGGSNGVAERVQAQVDRYTGSTGILDSQTDSLNARIDTIETQVERKERSVDKYQTRLRRQFSTLEQLLVDLNDQSNSFAALLTQQING